MLTITEWSTFHYLIRGIAWNILDLTVIIQIHTPDTFILLLYIRSIRVFTQIHMYHKSMTEALLCSIDGQ